MGFVLNQPSVNEIFKTIEEKEYSAPILEGGPVGLDNTFAIHQMGHIKDARMISKGFYIGGDFDTILAAFVTKPTQNRAAGTSDKTIIAHAAVLVSFDMERQTSAPTTAGARV